MLEKIISGNTVIMSLLNGIDSEEIIESKFGKGRCVYAFITKTDSTRVGRNVDFVADGKIYFGEKDCTVTQRTQDIASLFDSVNMDYTLSKNIITRQWKKFMVNIGMNQVSAVLGATYGDFLKSKEILKLIHDAMAEAVNVARAQGLDLSESDIESSIKFIDSLSAPGKTSMLQDVEAKRKTEVDMLAKPLIELGKKYNIPTPINEVLYLQIKALESLY